MQINFKNILCFLFIFIGYFSESSAEYKNIKSRLQELEAKSMKTDGWFKEIQNMKRDIKFIRKNVDSFIRELESSDCFIREKALGKFNNYSSDSKLYDDELKSKIPILNPNLKTKINLLLKESKRDYETLERIMDISINRLQKSKYPFPLIYIEFWRVKRKLLSVIKDPKEDLLVRYGALGFFVHDPSEGGLFYNKRVLRNLEKDFDGLDKNLKYITSLAMLNNFPEEVTSLNKIMPLFLKGLKEDDFYLRFIIQKTLKEFTGEDICVDPTDPLELRTEGIKKWEEWWKKNKNFKYIAKRKKLPEDPDAELWEELKLRHPEEKEEIDKFLKEADETAQRNMKR
ncbi:MAG: hypothetical protein A3C43_00035 [Candidatus Schekmanbacteria bacterium RIFCSPHIGHO2_02_FULL_38_11]|uniref:Uncharacterized protein n=1 Tax=Candidatus Schekmanbacteria bacterium RIFCSPLOWO2_12_FULL_38_15 TaxID=1817883 RepID=A0A1F7SEG0_9BACT|nr:MAG: hypothetical protein A2043_05600 [Candidatus Schekmanbacteria bacterium GWA2_38_9]OGL51648.1 MAG: hypothetical protein A3G31_05945 [Candidatus Schekmanbacteria bacterium RIFCSPLOWO2_12_FULL_38_15]OGL53122.1 MAG: hypothetical protein A3C43_00035 [Candidatus Schekmanbacteria bacterium RIFCSPHIGHO2_02_FULL_38_11]